MTSDPDADAPGRIRTDKDRSGAGTSRPTVYLHPGRLLVSAEPISILTILGSCVAVCLWDPVGLVGGVAHFVLPLGGANSTGHRFGDAAVQNLNAELLSLGARSSNLRAKVFGGAAVLGAYGPSPNRTTLGEKNIATAFRVLEQLGIACSAQDVGGTRGRKLVFYTDTGDAWVKAI